MGSLLVADLDEASVRLCDRRSMEPPTAGAEAGVSARPFLDGRREGPSGACSLEGMRSVSPGLDEV